jgi:hypothetical protein
LQYYEDFAVEIEEMNNRMLLNKNPKDRNSNSLRLIGKEGTYLYTAIIKQYATVVRIEESMTMRDNIFIMN